MLRSLGVAAAAFALVPGGRVSDESFSILITTQKLFPVDPCGIPRKIDAFARLR